jgi:hypothetical protein
LPFVLVAAAASYALPAATVSSARVDTLEVMGLQFGLDAVNSSACETPVCAPDYSQSSTPGNAVTATGFQLATHRVEGAACRPTSLGCRDPDPAWAVEQAGDAPALVGLVAAVLGCALALTWPRARRTLLIVVVLGGVATGLIPVALRYLPLHYYYDEPPSIGVGAGYVLALALFAAAIVIQVLHLARPRIAAPATKPQQ